MGWNGSELEPSRTHVRPETSSLHAYHADRYAGQGTVMTNLEIRRAAGTEDAAGIAECVRAAYSRYIERIGQPPGPMLDDYDQVVRDHRTYVIEEGGEILGALVLIEKDGGFSSTTLRSCHRGMVRGLAAACWSTRSRRRAGSGTRTSISTPTSG